MGMKLNERVILTNMCMVYRADGSFLVENRTKSDWPGLTFPGGHVKKDETMASSVVREMKEETGLTVSQIEEVGVYEWNEPSQGIRHVAALYRTNRYEGVLIPGDEGDVFWITPPRIADYPLSTDMDKLIAIMRRGIF
jgi:8-oxo-dGTP diphosphatase